MRFVRVKLEEFLGSLVGTGLAEVFAVRELLVRVAGHTSGASCADTSNAAVSDVVAFHKVRVHRGGTKVISTGYDDVGHLTRLQVHLDVQMVVSPAAVRVNKFWWQIRAEHFRDRFYLQDVIAEVPVVSHCDRGSRVQKLGSSLVFVWSLLGLVILLLLWLIVVMMILVLLLMVLVLVLLLMMMMLIINLWLRSVQMLWL